MDPKMSALTKTEPCAIKSAKDFFNLARTNFAGELQAEYDYTNTIEEIEKAEGLEGLEEGTATLAKEIYKTILEDEKTHQYMLAYLMSLEKGELDIKIKSASELKRIIRATDEGANDK